MKSSLDTQIFPAMKFPLVSSLRFIIPFFTFVLLAFPVNALDLSRPNNKVGIHLAVPETEDINRAAELVNSGGGRWGYVTLVIQENDLNKGKWQEVFNKLRRLKLIPVIRLATRPEGDKWVRPNEKDAEKFANFLNSLNWVVKERYVVLFNEPNHAAEWGGGVDAENYAKVALEFSKKLKEKNPDFFIMLAGIDASAPSAAPFFEDEANFLQKAFNSEPKLKEYIDGLASHSYPNPGFAGSPNDIGRGTIRTYEWELAYFQKLGIEKELPVFITETGWSKAAVSELAAAEFIKRAFEEVWLRDDRVRAVTPFVLNYQGEPFTQFSYKKFQSDEFYKQFHTTKEIAKTKGNPEKVEKGLIAYDFPLEVLADSNYHFKFKLKNEGQGYWEKADDYSVRLEGDEFGTYFFSNLWGIEPGKEAEVDFYFKTEEEGNRKFKLSLYKNDKKILEGKETRVYILPLPDLKIKVNLFPKTKDKASDFEIQIFDDKEELVYIKKAVSVDKGEGLLEKIKNVYLGGKFRVVILKPYYLPRQKHVVFKKGTNEIKFERMLPLDFDKDGNFDFWDFAELFEKPKLIKNLLP